MATCSPAIAAMGSPAWAGIDREITYEDPAQMRFPRVGGDRPSPTNGWSQVGSVPPRGRG